MTRETVVRTKEQDEDHTLLLNINIKLDAVIAEAKRNQESNNLRWADHEARVKVIERVHEILNPEQAFKDLKDLVQWKYDTQRDFKNTKAIIRAGWGAFGAILLLLAQQVLQYLHLMK